MKKSSVLFTRLFMKLISAARRPLCFILSPALFIAIIFIIALTLNISIFNGPLYASGVCRLDCALKQDVVDPLIDYSSFVKIKFEKYNAIIDKFLKTVRRSYFERYDEYKELMDIIRNDGSYYTNRA